MEIKRHIDNGIEAVKDFTRNKLEARRMRLNDPAFEASIEKVKDDAFLNLKKVGEHAWDAGVNRLIGGPFRALWEGLKEIPEVWDHNSPLNEQLDFLKKNNPDIKDGPKTMDELKAKQRFTIEKNKILKAKKSYSGSMVGGATAKLLSEYGKGGVSAAKMVAELAKFSGNSAIIAKRYLIGK